MISHDIQRFLRATPGLFLVLRPDADATIVAASDDYLRATYADPGIFGRPLAEAFPCPPGESGAQAQQNLRASLQRVVAARASDSMAAQRYGVRLPPERGGGYEERFWAAVNAPVLGDNGEVEFIVHRVEDASAKANRDAVEILESITEGFYTLDQQWRFGYVNREACRILDRQPGELPGQVIWEAYPGLKDTEFERRYRRSMFEQEKSSFTAFYQDHKRWYEVTTFPAPEGISVYFRNVTESKQAEAERDRLASASEKQRRIYETALNSTPDFVYVFDVDHRALYANDALLKTWGVTDVRGKTWMDLGYEQWHADMHDAELDRVISTRAPIRGEIPFTGTTGRRIYDYIFAPVLGRDGEVVAVAGTTRDITDRQAAEQSIREQAERLAASDRAKDEFLATLSHELRNPLAPLRNAIAVLQTSRDPLKSQAVLAMMERQVNHLVRLVDDLLEVSRISRGTFSLRMERVELASVVRNAVEANQPLIQAAGHTLEVQMPTEPLWMHGDAVRLAQILSNLLNNAATYTEQGGRITVRCWPEDGHAAICVRDTGVGMAPESVAHMFEMFSRGDRDSARSQGGLGIGLALSRRLAQMHNGNLLAHSAGLGKGSEFTMRIPLADGAQPETAPATNSEPLSNTRVLVVDDNHDAGDSLGMILEMLGAQVQVARGGAEALEVYPGYKPSAVLLDIGMPGMNGYEVARALRSQFPEQRAVLVALTGWGQEDDRRRAREAGFDHHLVKPAEIDALQQLLASIQDAPG